jgi:L-asparaginase
MEQVKILTVFTGGTIGSAPETGFLRPGGEETRRLLLDKFQQEKQSLYEQRFQKKIVWDILCPYEILSENLNGQYLEILWNTIEEAIQKESGYAGIIVTVGTDTLAYSSAALGYLFADIPIPVITVSANYPLTDVRSNGLDNLEGAVLLILEGGHHGGFCSYRNPEGHFIHEATRLLPQNNYDDRVYSVKDCFYAKLEQGKDGLECVRRKEEGLQQEIQRANEGSLNRLHLSANGLSRQTIYFCRPYPGMRFLLPEHTGAVLLDTYHSGTFPVRESHFREFVMQAKAQNIPVFAAGVASGLTYETIEVYRQENIGILPQASPAAMYIKLWLLLANGYNVSDNISVPIGNDLID